MAGQPAAAAQATLYRLRCKDGVNLEHLLQPKYVQNSFEPVNVQIGDIQCVMTCGNLSKEGPPDWVGHLNQLTGAEPQVANQTAAGLLLVPLEGFVFALSWGMGFLLFQQNYVDMGFGLRFADQACRPR